MNPTVLLSLIALFVSAATPYSVYGQGTPVKQNDSNTPLHLLKPEYPVPYGPIQAAQVTEVLSRIRIYLDSSTPARLINRQTGEPVTDFSKVDFDSVIEPGTFRLISYEWGVVYAGMLLSGEATGDPHFTQYALQRITFIADIAPHFGALRKADPKASNPLQSVLDPRALDDSGSMCAALIRASRVGVNAEVRPLINRFIDYISTKQQRLSDGTLARSRPQPDSLWLDDLYMSVPALAEMGRLTGESSYFDDAVKQMRQFSQRMFNRNKGLYMHGWVQGMEIHPEFHWARANGWAILAASDLLDVLPENHPARPQMLELLRAHLKGLASCQSGSGFWHQLLDRPDSYLETSATAIYTYCMAHAINEGWIDPLAYGPAALLGWHAVSTKVNSQGQVEGTCVGTGMGFDPAFYYYRPTNVYAAHGYGPALLAGGEMIKLLKNFRIEINDSSTQFYRVDASR